jgi:hypothetical protein
VTAYTKVTGAWVDGFPATLDQAGQVLRESLANAEFVTVVISDFHAAPRSVTLSGPAARTLARLADKSMYKA